MSRKKFLNQAILTDDGKVPVEANLNLDSATLEMTGFSTEAKQDALIADIATLQTSIDTIQALVDTIETVVDSGIVDVSIKSSVAVPVNDGGGSLTVDGSVSVTGVATEAKQDTINTTITSLVGATNASTPASDTASSTLNGRLQRIAQHLSSLIALFPSSVGIKNSASSLSVALSSDGLANDIKTAIGEIQANPTSNTLLSRLKAIVDAIGLVNTNGVFLTNGKDLLTHRTTSLLASPVQVKGSAGAIYSISVINPNTVPVYIKLYNATSGAVTVGTTTVVDTIPVSASNNEVPGFLIIQPNGVPFEEFSTAISMACVLGQADSSTTAPNNGVMVKIKYK